MTAKGREMILWGWGRKTVSRALDASTRVTRIYRYVHLFFIFSVAWGGQYVLSTLTEAGWAQRAITKEEAKSLMGGEELQPPMWRRFGLPAAAVVVVAVAALSH
jgi:hypothetical protein